MFLENRILKIIQKHWNPGYRWISDEDLKKIRAEIDRIKALEKYLGIVWKTEPEKSFYEKKKK